MRVGLSEDWCLHEGTNRVRGELLQYKAWVSLVGLGGQQGLGVSHCPLALQSLFIVSSYGRSLHQGVQGSQRPSKMAIKCTWDGESRVLERGLRIWGGEGV